MTVKHPGAPVWPARWLTTVMFTREEENLTRLTLRSEIVDDHTSDRRISRKLIKLSKLKKAQNQNDFIGPFFNTMSSCQNLNFRK